MKTVDHVRALLGPADPAAHVRVGPPATSATDLIVRAERSAGVPPRPGRARITRRQLIAAGVTVGVAGAAAGYPLVTALDSGIPEVALPPGDGVVVPMRFQLRDDPPAAMPQLRTLAGRIAAASYDGRTGRYAYHRTQGWGMVVQTSANGHDMSYVEEVRSWIAADGSGVVRRTQLGAEYPTEAARRHWEGVFASWKPDPKATTPVPGDGESLPPMGRANAVTDRASLAARLHLDLGGGDTVKAVFDVCTGYALPMAMRVALLEGLAGVSGLVWRGVVTDRAGRAGVAVSHDDRGHGVRQVLVFDQRTGELLAYEAVRPKADRVTVYGLLLETGVTDQPG